MLNVCEPGVHAAVAVAVLLAPPTTVQTVPDDESQPIQLVNVEQVSVAHTSGHRYVVVSDRGTWRARHVVSEDARTLDAANAMRVGDAETLGKLMNASHASLRDDFEVSSDALNLIVECAREHEGCIGARMTGGGFGGCAVALVRADAAEDFALKVAASYQERSGKTPAVYVCHATDGAAIINR